MKIPKRFKLLGATVEVVDNPKLVAERNWAGMANYDEHKIEMVPLSGAYQVSRAKLEQTFCHELCHFLLRDAGSAVNHELKDYLHKNEEFVELLGCLLHQVLDTMEFE